MQAISENGVTFEMDNGIWTIVSFLRVNPGKGAALRCARS